MNLNSDSIFFTENPGAEVQLQLPRRLQRRPEEPPPMPTMPLRPMPQSRNEPGPGLERRPEVVPIPETLEEQETESEAVAEAAEEDHLCSREVQTEGQIQADGGLRGESFRRRHGPVNAVDVCVSVSISIDTEQASKEP